MTHAVACVLGTLAQMLLAHPSLLVYDVEGHLKPLYEYLLSFGITGAQFVDAVQKRPSLLGLNVDANLSKIVGYLQDTGTSREQILDYILKTL